MLFLDANVFLRALTQSDAPDVARMNQIAADIFRQADQGEVELTTCDAVIAEVAFVLTSKAHYRLEASDAAGRIATLLHVRGMTLPNRRVILHALHLDTVSLSRIR